MPIEAERNELVSIRRRQEHPIAMEDRRGDAARHVGFPKEIGSRTKVDGRFVGFGDTAGVESAKLRPLGRSGSGGAGAAKDCE